MDRGKFRLSWVASVFLLLTVASGLFSYWWTRPTSFPTLAFPCVEYQKQCVEEQSGVFVYESNPRIPLTLTVEYQHNFWHQGHTDEMIRLGANVPAHESVNWMIQLVGTAVEKPEYQGKAYLPPPFWQVVKPPGSEMFTVRNQYPGTSPFTQILEGTIRGPINTLKPIPITFPTHDNMYQIDSESQVLISGQSTGHFVSLNTAFVLGDLPCVSSGAPPLQPGQSLSKGDPAVNIGQAQVPGQWYRPRVINLRESYQPIEVQGLWQWKEYYDEPSTTKPNSVSWNSTGSVCGNFGLENLVTVSDARGRRTLAYVALGFAGGAFLGLIQALSQPSTRRRRSRGARSKPRTVRSKVIGAQRRRLLMSTSAIFVVAGLGTWGLSNVRWSTTRVTYFDKLEKRVSHWCRVSNATLEVTQVVTGHGRVAKALGDSWYTAPMSAFFDCDRGQSNLTFFFFPSLEFQWYWQMHYETPFQYGWHLLGYPDGSQEITGPKWFALLSWKGEVGGVTRQETFWWLSHLPGASIRVAPFHWITK